MNRLERIETLSKAVKDHNELVKKSQQKRREELSEMITALNPRFKELLEVRREFESLWGCVPCSFGDDKITFDIKSHGTPLPNISFSHTSNKTRYSIAITLPYNGYTIRFFRNDTCICAHDCDSKTMEMFLEMYDDFERETYELIDSILDETDKSLSESDEETYVTISKTKGEKDDSL